jgi:hypothetical protein
MGRKENHFMFEPLSADAGFGEVCHEGPQAAEVEPNALASPAPASCTIDRLLNFKRSASRRAAFRGLFAWFLAPL